MMVDPVAPADSSDSALRVLVVDDHALVRAGVRSELAAHAADLEVVGEADDVEGAVAAVHALTRVAAGDAAFSPRLAGFVLDAFGAGAGEVAVADSELDRLSSREREVMRLIARGYTYRECAGELFISIKTVETHVSAVLRKLQLSNRNELTRWAAARHLL